MRDSKKGQIALILGNGPSLQKLNLVDVKKKRPDIFVTNGFYRNHFAQFVEPTFYCFSDPTFFFDTNPVSHSISDTFQYIRKTNCQLLISHFYRKVPLNCDNRIIYFNDREFSVLSRNINPCKPRGYASQTIMKALSVAIYLGYDRIYLLGVDNTEHRALFGDASNGLWARTDVYYGNPHQERFDYQLTAPNGVVGMFLQYTNWFADFKKFAVGNVYNLDLSSLIDVFPKVDSFK